MCFSNRLMPLIPDDANRDWMESKSPTKFFEYMAMGKATIAPDLPPLREFIKHGINGLLIRPGDPEDLKTKIMELISNSELRYKLGRNAVDSIISTHTWDINSRKIMRIFETLLQPAN